MSKVSKSSFAHASRTHRVSFRLSDADYRVFCLLSERGGFQSLSSFLRYLAYCALRANGDGLTMETPVSVLRLFRAGMEMDRETLETAARLTAEARRAASAAPPPSSVGEEIGEMFRELSAEGARLTFPGDVNFRK